MENASAANRLRPKPGSVSTLTVFMNIVLLFAGYHGFWCLLALTNLWCDVRHTPPPLPQTQTHTDTLLCAGRLINTTFHSSLITWYKYTENSVSRIACWINKQYLVHTQTISKCSSRKTTQWSVILSTLLSEEAVQSL
jgi:hypothetical protein